MMMSANQRSPSELTENKQKWLQNLTGGKEGGLYITDVTNASRTMLMNIETLSWDPTLCRYFDIPIQMLPEIRSSSEIYGNITIDALKGIPISGVSYISKLKSVY